MAPKVHQKADGGHLTKVPSFCVAMEFQPQTSTIDDNADLNDSRPMNTKWKRCCGATRTYDEKCRASHAANIRTKGPHEFFNMMWDPRVYRGNCLKTYDTAEYSRQRTGFRFRGKSCEDDSSDLVKRRKFPRNQFKYGGIDRSKIDKLHNEHHKKSLEDMGMQTDKFLEDLTQSTTKNDKAINPEPKSKLNKDYGLLFKPVTLGKSASTQCDLGQTFFGKNVDPIKKHMSAKILEQSLLETTEELELEEVRKENRKFMELRRQEVYKQAWILAAQRKVAQERDSALASEKQAFLIAAEAEKRVGAAMFAAKTMGGMMPIAFSLLELEGYFNTTAVKDVYEHMMPYLDREIKKYYKMKTTTSRNLLDDLLQNVANQREAEVAESMWIKRSRSGKLPAVLPSTTDSRTFSLSLERYAGGSMPFDIEDIRND